MNLCFERDSILYAADADVIKTYIRLGLGIGIIAKMAYLPEIDNDLVALDVEHIFGISTIQIVLRKNKYIRSYIYRFIEMFVPHLMEEVVNRSMACSDIKGDVMFGKFSIPKYD